VLDHHRHGLFHKPKSHTMKARLSFLSFLVGLVLTINTQAREIGQFAPGVLNIRDFAMPEPGFYGVLYNYGYTTDRLNDRGGRQQGGSGFDHTHPMNAPDVNHQQTILECDCSVRGML
jgi:hypothetical protein